MLRRYVDQDDEVRGCYASELEQDSYASKISVGFRRHACGVAAVKASGC